jgi:hypothetical protein
MRSREVPIQRVELVEVALDDRLRVTAERLSRMPAGVATSLSLTVSRQGRSDTDLGRLAATIALRADLGWAVESEGDVVTVIFRRSPRGAR